MPQVPDYEKKFIGHVLQLAKDIGAATGKEPTEVLINDLPNALCTANMVIALEMTKNEEGVPIVMKAVGKAIMQMGAHFLLNGESVVPILQGAIAKRNAKTGEKE